MSLLLSAINCYMSRNSIPASSSKSTVSAPTSSSRSTDSVSISSTVSTALTSAPAPELTDNKIKAYGACIYVINEIFQKQIALENVPSLITEANKSYKEEYFWNRPFSPFPKICLYEKTWWFQLEWKQYNELLQIIDQKRIKAGTDCICAIRMNSNINWHPYVIAIIDSTARSIIHFFDPLYNTNKHAYEHDYQTFSNSLELADLLSKRHKQLYYKEPLFNSESTLFIKKI